MHKGEGRKRGAAASQLPRKAIVLSAGQARRLLPFTETTPKCLLPVDNERTMLEVQLQALAACGIQRAVIMLGFEAQQVEDLLSTISIAGLTVETRYNPFFETSNNLITCWLAVPEMDEDFVLLNGDTLFEAEVLRRLLLAPQAPVTLAVDRKAAYDDDDMKVALCGERQLAAVGKTLAPAMTDGESIGLMVFRERGRLAFRQALARAVRKPAALQHWYLSVIDTLARTCVVEVASIEGLWWAEIDTPSDLIQVRSSFAEQRAVLNKPAEFSILEEA